MQSHRAGSPENPVFGPNLQQGTDEHGETTRSKIQKCRAAFEVDIDIAEALRQHDCIFEKCPAAMDDLKVEVAEGQSRPFDISRPEIVEWLGA